MIPVAVLLALARNIVRESIMIAAWVGLIIVALFTKPGRKNQPPVFRSKSSLLWWRMELATLGLALIAFTVYSFHR